MGLFTTPSCQTVYCPVALMDYLKDQAKDRETRSPRCLECEGFIDFNAIDEFVRRMPCAVNEQFVKKELMIHMLDRSRSYVVCPSGHSVFDNWNDRVVSCTVCLHQEVNPFYCRKCRHPLLQSQDECSSRQCMDPVGNLNQMLRESPKKVR